jgi:predicted outer membrane repeat protein
MSARSVLGSAQAALVGAMLFWPAAPWEKPAGADIINVPDDYPTIHEAIDAADDGDEVVIAPGEYFENIDLLGKAITVRSTDPKDAAVIAGTIINGGGVTSVVTCHSSEGPDTVLNGLVITNGHAAFEGGGLSCQASPTVINCTFSDNTAEAMGGGIRCDGYATLRNCTFSRNTAQVGGAICSSGYPFVTNCAFIGNTAVAGGGVAHIDVGMWAVTMTGCTFIGNVATHDSPTAVGGAIHVSCGMFELSDCTFIDNSSTHIGGGLYFGISSFATVANCRIVGNRPVGLYAEDCSPTLSHCVICGNGEAEINGQYVDGGNNIIGPHPPPPRPACPADIDGDGDVDTTDLLALLAAWGMCP